MILNRPDTKEKRVNLRRLQTPAERTLWRYFRRKQTSGVKFFRQYGIGHYIVDFCAPTQRLVIELDGAHHRWNPDVRMNDEAGTEQLTALHYTVLRFTNDDVRYHIQDVLNRIEVELMP